MHPILFRVFGVPISPYGILIACGLLVGIFIARRRARRVGIPEDAVLDVIFWGVILGFVGARVAFLVVSWEHFVRAPLAMIFSREGFVFMGGLITAIPVVLLFTRRWGVRFGAMADVLAPPLALAHAFGRTGCFFAGCCYGSVTSVPWAVRFPRHVDPSGQLIGSPALVDQASAGLCPWDATHSLPVHPTQLYDVVIQLALFGFLTWYTTRRRFHGQVFLAYLWLYPATRILLEFFRGDIERGVFFDLFSTSQILSALTLVAALVLTLRRRDLFAPLDAPVLVSPPGGAEERPAAPRDNPARGRRSATR